QDESEIDRLMRSTKKAGLLFDTGHLAFAGADPLKMISRYRDRVAHVHLKDVRSVVVEAARSEGLSFEAALMRGVFTVPGDGAIDFAGIFSVLAEADYEGWMVVEAEQDPKKAPPLEYARKGREYVRVEAGL
ncbi:MAG: TIM barrel protein, partial [Elusimicrobiota bacterium]